MSPRHYLVPDQNTIVKFYNINTKRFKQMYGELKTKNEREPQHRGNEFNDTGMPESYDIGHDYAKYTSSITPGEKHYKQTRYGYARGHEAVSYVNNIRNFYNVIAWKEQERAKQEALAAEENETDKPLGYESIISSALEELEIINAM